MYIRDDAIKAALVTMFNKLIFSRKHLLKSLLQSIRESSGDENVRRMQELQQLTTEELYNSRLAMLLYYYENTDANM